MRDSETPHRILGSEVRIAEMSISLTAYDRILKVARTLADIDGTAAIAAKHIAEAIR